MAQLGQSPASSGFKFNSFQEIKSHSSILYNERMAILFYMLDMKSIELNKTYDVEMILEVRALIKQIYKNIRMLLRFNPTARATLNLDTKDSGIYVTDVIMGTVDKMIEFCENNGYTTRRVYIIVQELNNIETLVKDCLQYFSYFIRPDFKQKPDVEMATERYKEMADMRTVEELREIAGRNNKIDWNSLGTSKIEMKDEIEYDEKVDGPRDDDDDEEYSEDDDEEKELEE